MAEGPRWMFNPTSGGTTIPDRLRPTVAARIRQHLEEHFAGRYHAVEVRFRGKFCYVDVYQDAELSDDWPSPGFGETREQARERLREVPLHLCRLRFRGRDTWSFDLYSYASERYEPNVFATGDWVGGLEEAVGLGALLYLARPAPAGCRRAFTVVTDADDPQLLAVRGRPPLVAAGP